MGNCVYRKNHCDL